MAGNGQKAPSETITDILLETNITCFENFIDEKSRKYGFLCRKSLLSIDIYRQPPGDFEASKKLKY